MILEIDAGNSRVKWRQLDGAARGAVTAGCDDEALLRELAGQFEASLTAPPARIRVANVRGADFARSLAALCQRMFGREPAFAEVTESCGPVRTAYREPGAMGVDRWLAILAAHAAAGGRPCCVADFGSALTVDIVDGDGRHRGGYIVPGIGLMRQSLAGKSGALGVTTVDMGSAAPGTTTEEAIGHGIVSVCLGLLERLSDQCGDDALWFITGGDAELISGLLHRPHERVPELVMDGLAIALP